MSARHLSAFARAQGLGAAGHGAAHWRAQRVSAVALIVLLPWLALSLAGGRAADHAALMAWLGSPIEAGLMILLLIAAFHHAALGLQVVAEDYIHSRARFGAVALIHLAAIAGALCGTLAVLRIAFAG